MTKRWYTSPKLKEFEELAARGETGRALYHAVASKLDRDDGSVSAVFKEATPHDYAGAITLAIRGGYLLDIPLDDITAHMNGQQKADAVRIVDSLVRSLAHNGHGDGGVPVHNALADLQHIRPH